MAKVENYSKLPAPSFVTRWFSCFGKNRLTLGQILKVYINGISNNLAASSICDDAAYEIILDTNTLELIIRSVIKVKCKNMNKRVAHFHLQIKL